MKIIKNYNEKLGEYEYVLYEKTYSLDLINQSEKINHRGILEYYRNDLLDRPSREGPAVLRSDGSFEYRRRGFYHRPEEEGPTIEVPNQIRFWYDMGYLSRRFGGAVEKWDGQKWIGIGYFLNGKCYSDQWKSEEWRSIYEAWRSKSDEISFRKFIQNNQVKSILSTIFEEKSE